MSENLTFQNLLKKDRKVLTAEQFGNIMSFDKESKRKPLSLTSVKSFIKNNLDMTLGLKFIMTKWKFF